MIPIRHTLPLHKTPIVNRALVIANVAIFIGMLFLGDRAEIVMDRLGYIPARLLNPPGYGFTWMEVPVTPGTSLFIHGGIVHLFGNMLYLGDLGGVLGDVFGAVRYVRVLF